MALDRNSVTIIGRLTDTPSLAYGKAKGTPVCNLSVAVNGRSKKDTGEKLVDYIPVVVFGKQAEAAAANLVRGQQVSVDGVLRFRPRKVGDVNIPQGSVIANRVDFGMKPKAAMPAAA